MRKSLSVVLAFAQEHYMLAVYAGVLITLFLFVGHFAELVYGAIRLAFVFITAAAMLNMVFKGTLRPYINDGTFVTDFHAMPPLHKVWLTVAVVVFIVLAAVLCFALP